ncbi:hypothetical protein BKA70DRAFT_1560822 [Coprinopsis sp. MPI-PUGE-AT-0042]|nr:hypothetical protein BKA70DRAFT_1560822 [Coprinopsis sp. MPI-PUGE-AT-0042]
MASLELSPYLSSNLPLPHDLKPTLGTYLTQTSSCIAKLDAEIDQLERTVDTKRGEREQYKQVHKEHSRLEASIRSIPPEIWGIIFAFTLGHEPFGIWEYRMYGYLRRVCWDWRDVAASTPDICRGLVVHLDGPLTWTPDGDKEGVWCLRQKLQPWLAIVSRNHPYHLVLGLEDEESYEWTGHVAEIVQWILATVPAPTILSLTTSDIFSMAYVGAPRDNKITHLTLDFWQDLDREVLEETPFQEVFPCLEVLAIDAPIEFLSPMRHDNLQCLTLTQIRIYSSAYDFSVFLLDLPALRELRIDSQDPYCLGPDPSANQLALIHPTLEILIVEGEDLMLLLEHIAFPSLKFFGLGTWGSHEEYETLAEIVPAFFQRCSLDNKNFTATFRGLPTKFIFDLVMHSIPLGSRLHLNAVINWDGGEEEEMDTPYLPAPDPPRTLTAICCSHLPDDLGWLGSHHIRSPDNLPAKLYIPKSALERAMEAEVGDRLLDGGYALQILEVGTYKELLRSWIPPMSVKWEV